MTNQHPITLPSELLQLWFEQHHDYNKGINELLIEAVQYGADRELEACCEWLASLPNNWTSIALKRVSDLRAVRRPKPPSAVAQAEALIERYEDGWCPSPAQWHVIREGLAEGRRALEQLDD